MSKLNSYTDTFKELLIIYLTIVAVGALVFSFAEGKALWDSLWWTFVTSMTVGYGDIYPVTVIGRIDAIVLMHFVPLFLAPVVVARLMTKILDDRNQFTHEEQEVIKNDIAEIKSAVMGK